MPFLGVSPTQEFTSVAKQTITGDGSTSYTLNKGVSTENDLAVFVNDVRQEPGVAYTAQANTITFTANLESTDSCYVLHIGRSFSSASSPGIDDDASTAKIQITTDGHILPTANVAYDLGSSDMRFRDLYLSGSSLHLGAHEMTANATHVLMGNVVTTSVNATDTFTLTSSANTSSAGPDLILYRDSESPADGDYLGQIQFKGKNDNNGDEIYAKVTGKISDASLSTEDGLIETAIKGAGSFTIVSRQRSDELQLLNGVGLSVAGDTTLSSNVTISETLTIAGDLVVNGNTTTIAANELKVEDSLIQLATNNEISDTVDIGFVGHYSNDGGTTALHTGFFRDASDEKYYLFNGYEDAAFDTATPPSTIDRTANTFSLAHLNVGLLDIDGGSEPYVLLRPTDGSLGNAQIKFDGTDYTIVSNSSSAKLKLATNSTDRLTILHTGEVGIGQSSPDYPLHITSTNVGPVMIETTSASGSYIRFRSSTTAAAPDNVWIGAVGNDTVFFANNTLKTMTIDSSGNVGIGNDNPTEKLVVDGVIITGASASTNGGTVLKADYLSASSDFINTLGTERATSAWVLGYGVEPDSTTSGVLNSTADNAALKRGALIVDDELRYLSATSSTTAVGSPVTLTQRFMIDENGKVGVGSNSPNAYLHVRADAGSDSVMRIRNENTTSRTTTLQLEDYSGALADGVLKFVFPNAGSTTGSYLGLLYNSAGLYIAPGGSVGINTTTPSSLFHVNGNASTSQTFYVDVGNYNDTQTLFEHTGATTPVPFKIAKSGYTGASTGFGILQLHMNHSTTGGGSNLHFTLLDSSSTVTEYAGIGAQIVDNTNGAEDGRLNFWVTNNGSTRQNKMYLDNNGALNLINSTSSDMIFDADHTAFSGRHVGFPGRFVIGPAGNGYPNIGYNFRPDAAGNYYKIAGDTSYMINFGSSDRINFYQYGSASAGTSIPWNFLMSVGVSSNITELVVGDTTTTNRGTLVLAGSTANKYSKEFCSNGNLHIDAADTHGIYLNWYTSDNYASGTSGGVYFGSGSASQVGFMSGTGNLSISGTLTESSALRYKENVQDLEYNNIICQLKPKIYNKIGEEKQEVGLIAEDVEVLDKTLVTYNDDGQVEGIQYTRLVPHLIAHIQKLEERLAALENG